MRREQCPKCGLYYDAEKAHTCIAYEPPPDFIAKGVLPPPTAEPIDPVCGWLVCLDGAEKGLAYRLVAGKNNIGGGRNCAIGLSFDARLDPEPSGTLLCDPEHGAYYLMNLGGRDLLRLNGELLVSPAALADGDLLQVGAQRLQFVALQWHRFAWE